MFDFLSRVIINRICFSFVKMQNKEIRKFVLLLDAMIRLSSNSNKTKLTLINQKLSSIQYALYEMEICDKLPQ